MIKEIDILLQAATTGHAVVEKSSNVLWSCSDLADARESGCYADEDRLGAPTAQIAVSGPFPGCIQCSAAPAHLSRYRLIGETEHFLIFAPPGEKEKVVHA